MYSTGVEALDSRLGGVDRNKFFLVLGPHGVGKSVLGTHFLTAGLERKERCLLVTSDSPEDLDARGLYMGFSPGPFSRHPSLERLDGRGAVQALGASHRYPPVEALRQAVDAGEGTVSRLVVDDVNSFLRSSHAPEATAQALVDYLDQLGTTAYLIVSTAADAALPDTVVQVFTDSAAAVLSLDQAGHGRRRLAFQTVRQASFSADPFLYTLRSGGGFAEDLPAYDREVAVALRRRIVILDEGDVLPPEVITALGVKFEVETFNDLNGSLSQLLEARYGVLILGTDPYDPERTFNLAYSLRKAGNGAPILFISRSKGLRSTTRARALRIGGDDFLIAELPPQEIVERITVTAQRGHHRRNGTVRPDRALQPRDDEGTHRPMTATEITKAVSQMADEAPTPFFAVIIIDPQGKVSSDELWSAIGRQIRLADGDLLAIMPDGMLAMVLNQVDMTLSRRVLGRLSRAHPALDDSLEATVLTSPLQSDEIRNWLAEVEFRQPS